MQHLFIKFSFSLLLGAVLMACTGTEARQHATENTIAKTVDLVEWERLIEEKPGTVLDVRTQNEYRTGYVPNAILIDWYSETFNDEAGKLDKKLPMYIYCHSGGRSKRAMDRLSDLGFTEIYNLKGGMQAWKRAHP